MAEEEVLPIPNLLIAQNLFVLSSPNLKRLHEKARTELVEGIKADGMRSLLQLFWRLRHPLTHSNRNGTLL